MRSRSYTPLGRRLHDSTRLDKRAHRVALRIGVRTRREHENQDGSGFSLFDAMDRHLAGLYNGVLYDEELIEEMVANVQEVLGEIG